MTVLTLNGTQVFPAGNQTIKLTRENPYFTQSESYTLDVTLPMDILENRQFFGPLHRLERSKWQSTMTCLLTVNNKPVLSGTAKITQITEKDVKVQLIGGMSEIKFMSTENKTYIDEMEMGGPTLTFFPNERGGNGGVWNRNDLAVRYVNMPVYDETHDLNYNETSYVPQPRLNDILKEVLAECGYTLVDNPFDVIPWNCLYIASAMRTLYLSHTLPHWTVREFIEEYCHFFNCTLITDEMARTVRVIANADFFGASRQTPIVPVDEFVVELSEEASGHSLSTDNLRFDLSNSPEHDYDIISDDLRDAAPTEEYASRAEAYAAYVGKDENERLNNIYKTPIGRWAGWKLDFSDIGIMDELPYFTQIDVFAPLIRDAESDSETSLKIVPVAMSEAYTVGTRTKRWTFRKPSLECPTWGDSIEGRGSLVSDETSTIQEYVEGDANIEKAEKEDRLQVFFVDDIEQDSIHVDSSGHGTLNPDSRDIQAVLMPFTDFLYKRNHSGKSHRQWSLSLNPTAAEHYLGQLHQNSYSFNMKAKYCVKFLADEMPDPTQVFIIRNKRFACEKIEAQIDDQGLQQLMTGYFYEML